MRTCVVMWLAAAALVMGWTATATAEDPAPGQLQPIAMPQKGDGQGG